MSASVLFGLIGKPVKHSFSKGYFTEKFDRLELGNHHYELFELDEIQEFPHLLRRYPNLKGLNVTLPYKKQVIPYLDQLSDEANRIGAVNTIRIDNQGLTGFNTDYHGFKKSLVDWAGQLLPKKALILGQGGACAAVFTALKDLGISCLIATRNPQNEAISYHDLGQHRLSDFPLIVNTTPVGMAPNTEDLPPIDLDQVNSRHFIYDLVYNPQRTMLMKQGQERGAQVKNGLEMLHLQAEKAWEIWTA